MFPIVSGLGVDPALHVDIFQEIDLEKSSAGVSQVQGFHNESRAYQFEGTINSHFTAQLNRHVLLCIVSASKCNWHPRKKFKKAFAGSFINLEELESIVNIWCDETARQTAGLEQHNSRSHLISHEKWISPTVKHQSQE